MCRFTRPEQVWNQKREELKGREIVREVNIPYVIRSRVKADNVAATREQRKTAEQDTDSQDDKFCENDMRDLCLPASH